ncbi:Calcineurin-like phosphoesterase [Reichenbachiella faecimaris]|uniref:Calcineurin-like phosphoesterase n=1 Tax=Reichenbachiella faecimaris TaxID=692418 RepID=A0A1W2GIC5_REIFA|nr:metallophosphoesterase [Reichenbachiella faecimaris]SMD36321.1 Calcineurin-like phosphoesterase [Reichenbachiella faecimaris]
MKKLFALLLMSSFLVMYGAFVSERPFNDGPYVFEQGKKRLVKWVEHGVVKKKTLSSQNYDKFKSEDARYFNPKYLFTDYKNEAAKTFDFSGVKKIAALSDIHGQYDLFIKILKNNGVIDDQNQWVFGDGHFVIVGDVFDRGDKVQECLWFIYQLEQQAEKSGGKVHYLLGNHEVMVLTGDLRYIHDKYRQTEQLLQMPYWQIFGSESVLGAWLRTKPVTMSINDIQFVHGGLSPALAMSKISVAEINSTFSNQIIDAMPEDSIFKDPKVKLLDGSQGPIWYRGYFRDSTFTESKLDGVLDYFDKNHVVVGHTSQYRVASDFSNKVILVDSSIKVGEAGEILLVENGEFFVGNMDGVRRKL